MNPEPEAATRTSGLLLHLTSLHGPDAAGTMGPEAFEFLRRMAVFGQRIWQILPVHPTIMGDSPFQGPSAFAGNPNLISLELLVEHGDLKAPDYREYLDELAAFMRADPSRRESRSEFGFLWERKLGFDPRTPGFESAALRRAFAGFRRTATPVRRAALEDFRRRNADWLEDYAAFLAIKESHGYEKPWSEWPEHQKLREGDYLAGTDPDTLDYHRYVQFVFDEQMRDLHRRATDLGVELVGDLAMYPGYDSADVWANRGIFQLDSEGRSIYVAAVPPDYFSETGQLWGNPVYKWREGDTREPWLPTYEWWLRRLNREYAYFDRLKIDHFRGFVAYGRTEAGEATGANTVWTPGPSYKLFEFLADRMGVMPPLVAEDLGIITDRVKALLRMIGCPGMRVFLFADLNKEGPLAESDDNYLPHNAGPGGNCVFFTGTHDNETFMQKYDGVLTEEQREKLDEYLARSGESSPHFKAIDLLEACGANYVILPVQDVLGLGAEARMNCPSQTGWWRWRLGAEDMRRFIDIDGPHLAELTARGGRISR